MTPRESLWSLGMLGVLLFANWVFRRRRRRTENYSEVQTFKARLPQWVQTVEKAAWVTLLLLVGGAVFRGFWTSHSIVRPSHPLNGASAVFSVIGTGLIVLPIAMLGANGISFLLPPVRAANLRAMEGLRLSWRDMNRALIHFGCVSVPVGGVLLLAAVFEPWAP
jgi:hypothetical protein